MWLLLYLETVEGVKVQLIWEICQRSFIGHRCLRHDGTFGQLKHPVSARSIADVTCKVKRRLRKCPSHVIKGQCRLFSTCFGFELIVVDHDAACWNKVWCAEAYAVGQTNQILPKQRAAHSFTYRPKNKLVKLRGHCMSLVLHSFLLQWVSKWTQSGFTPQGWILLHVIRNDFAGIHVTKVEFTSLLCKMRTWWESET